MGGAPTTSDTILKMDELYVKACFGSFALYGLQMLVVPDKMVTDHFDAPATPLLKFWIRGEAAVMAALCYSVTLVPTAAAAKFGYLTDGKLPVKYPMHYVPEILMATLSAAGA